MFYVQKVRLKDSGEYLRIVFHKTFTYNILHSQLITCMNWYDEFCRKLYKVAICKSNTTLSNASSNTVSIQLWLPVFEILFRAPVIESFNLKPVLYINKYNLFVILLYKLKTLESEVYIFYALCPRNNLFGIIDSNKIETPIFCWSSK